MLTPTDSKSLVHPVLQYRMLNDSVALRVVSWWQGNIFRHIRCISDVLIINVRSEIPLKGPGFDTQNRYHT
jgi:hypothetical protein